MDVSRHLEVIALRKILPTVCCWLMILVLPFNAVAANTAGMLSSVGTVLVDNQPTGASSAVFAGNLIETKGKSKAVVASPGKTVTLAENSTLRIAVTGLELESGSFIVSSAAGTLRVDNVTVTATAPSKFLARKVNGTLQL